MAFGQSYPLFLMTINNATIHHYIQKNFFFRIMSHMLGFTRVFRLMASHRKIIIGHNHFMDLMILYEKFYKPLPGMLFLFKS